MDIGVMTGSDSTSPESKAPDIVAAAEPAPLAEGKSTSFTFTHIVFRAPGARFVGDGNERTPMFAIDLGDTKGLLSIQALRRQFNIPPDSPDDHMITLAVRSLKYVADIRPGDSIPNEILTGKASWMIDPRHSEIARRRLELQLLATASSAVDTEKNAVTLTDTRAISLHLERPENKAKLKEAFRTAAKAMGRAEDDHIFVLEKLATFARELAYIEALREWFLQVGAIHKKLQVVSQAYDGDRRLKGEISQMRSLLMPAMREYRDIFASVDEQSADVIAALTSVTQKVEGIRGARDRLHNLTLVWKEIVVQWRNCNKDNGVRYLAAAQATYRFLATRHSSGHSLLANTKGKPAF